jgi:hypothetical protein
LAHARRHDGWISSRKVQPMNQPMMPSVMSSQLTSMDESDQEDDMRIANSYCVLLLIGTMLAAGAAMANDKVPADLSGHDMSRAAVDIDKASEIWKWIGEFAAQVAPEGDLEDQERRTHYFKPSALIERPVILLDDGFARDPGKRKKAIQEWQQFIDEDSEEIVQLRHRRDEQVARAADLPQRIARLRQSLQNLHEIKDDPAFKLFFGEAPRQALDIHTKQLRLMQELLFNRKRIIAEYDALLARREAEHKGYVSALHALEAIQGVQNEQRLPEDDRATSTHQPVQTEILSATRSSAVP